MNTAKVIMFHMLMIGIIELVWTDGLILNAEAYISIQAGVIQAEHMSSVLSSVYLNLSTYLHTSPVAQGKPVTLCIKGTNLYLSCHQDDAVPTLHLEVRFLPESHLNYTTSHLEQRTLSVEISWHSFWVIVFVQCDVQTWPPETYFCPPQLVEDKTSLSPINSESEMVRFLFYKHDTGLNISTLMSARFPDWYISTQDSDDEKLEMCQETSQRYRTFTFQHQS